MNIIYYDIPEIVKIRKHDCDIVEFQKFLKSHKNMPIKKIAQELNLKKTEVEHWFRSDKYFSIPNSDKWYELKKLLKIECNLFDAFVMEFIEKYGVHEQSNRVYDINGISPTITSTNADIKIII